VPGGEDARQSFSCVLKGISNAALGEVVAVEGPGTRYRVAQGDNNAAVGVLGVQALGDGLPIKVGGGHLGAGLAGLLVGKVGAVPVQALGVALVEEKGFFDTLGEA